jgi:HEAT repeat protein
MKKRLIYAVCLFIFFFLLGVVFWVKVFSPIRGLKDENRTVRARAVKALATSWVPDRVTRLAGALRDEDKDVRQWAVDALRRIGNEAALQTLVAALQDATYEEHWAVAVALGYFGEPAFEPLVAALQHEDVRVRKAAAMGMQPLLSNVEDPQFRAKAIEPLLGAANDTDKEMAGVAIYALHKIGAPAIEPMIRAMKHWDHTLCYHAEVTMKEIDEPAVEPLVRAARR